MARATSPRREPKPAQRLLPLRENATGSPRSPTQQTRPTDTRALHDGWYFTGDTGYFDAEGDLFVTGRVDDMIISGGENVSPADIESVLSLHPAVAEVAVVGMPDERWGQRVAAFVKRAPNADVAVEPVVLDAWCRA